MKGVSTGKEAKKIGPFEGTSFQGQIENPVKQKELTSKADEVVAYTKK